MKKAYCDRLDVRLLELTDRSGERGLVQRDLDPAVGANALADAETELARHQRLGRRLAQVVAVVLQALAHLEHVAMALGREQADPRPLALEQRVGRDRRAVDDPLGPAEHGATLEAERRGQPLQPRHHADRGIGGVEAALAIVTAPLSSTATRSVKVPPTSMPMRTIAQRPAPLGDEAEPAITRPLRFGTQGRIAEAAAAARAHVEHNRPGRSRSPPPWS